jgi:hypothetical protein
VRRKRHWVRSYVRVRHRDPKRYADIPDPKMSGSKWGRALTFRLLPPDRFTRPGGFFSWQQPNFPHGPVLAQKPRLCRRSCRPNGRQAVLMWFPAAILVVPNLRIAAIDLGRPSHRLDQPRNALATLHCSGKLPQSIHGLLASVRADMKHKPALYALERLHAELGGQIAQNKREAKRLAQAMVHVEAVLKMLEPS